MSANTQGLLNKLPTIATCLCGEVRIDSYHLMTGSCGLILKNIEKCAPTGVHDGFSEMVIFHHIRDLKVFNCNQLIAFGVRFSCLEMVISTLPLNLQVCLRHVLSGFTAPVRAFLASTQLALLASQGTLGGAIEARIVNRVAFTISQKGLESYIDTDVSMGTDAAGMLSLLFRLTDEKRIPMIVSTQDQIDSLWLALKRAMQFDLDGLANLARNDEMLLVFVQIDIFSVLPELDGVPLIALLKTREAHFQSQFFAGEKPFERFGEAIGKTLYRCGRDMLSATSFETSGEIILPREGPLFFILLLDRLKHLIIDMSGLDQALHEQVGLFFLWIQTVFKCPHRYILSSSLELVKFPPAGGRAAIHPHGSSQWPSCRISGRVSTDLNLLSKLYPNLVCIQDENGEQEPCLSRNSSSFSPLQTTGGNT